MSDPDPTSVGPRAAQDLRSRGEASSSSGRRVTLALGSGGARGYAHIGVAAELRARGFDVVAISGASMGALVGAFVAAGRLDELTAWARSLRRADVVRLLDATSTPGGVVAGHRLVAALRPILGETRIENLQVPFTAVATDLVAAREVWFQDGPVLEAVRASIAIPGAFTPALIDGRLLADGGLLNPVPIDPLAAVRADLLVAVSLQGPRALAESSTSSIGPGPLRGLRRRGGQGSERRAEHTGPLDPSPAPSPTGAALTVRRTSEVVSLSLDAMQQLITRYRLAGQSADLLLTIPVGSVHTLDLHRAEEMIDLGHRVTAQALDMR